MTKNTTTTDTPIVGLSIPRARGRATVKSESAATVAMVPIATALGRKEVPHAQSNQGAA